MSKSNKKENPFAEKLKQWLKGQKKNINAHGEEITLSPELVDSISPSSPLLDRLKILKDLKDDVKNGLLQDKGVEVLLYNTKDLLAQDCPETRHSILSFYEVLISCQYSRLGIVRSAFFNLIKENHSKRGSLDFSHHISLLYVLTEKGKDILYFEDEFGHFIKEIIPYILPQSRSTLKFLEMITICLNFNASYLDPDVILAFITLVSSLCTSTNDKNETIACLQILDAIICYSFIPKNGLLLFISILSRVVNLEAYGKDAWDITRRLMGTHLGHSALYCLSMIVQTRENHSDVALIRGSIFFIGFSLWGPHRIKTLDYSAVTILPTFVHALRCKHHLVVFEVIQQVKQLVTIYDKDLHAAACDAIVELIELLLIEIRGLDTNLKDNISSHLHAVITILEGLSEMKRYSGSKQKLFGMLDLCADNRPEESVIRLITFRQKSIHAAKSKWLKIFHDLVERYYKREKRVNIRLKILDVILDVFKSNHYSYEEELIDKIIIPFLGHVHMETEPRIRGRAIEILTTLCSLCETNKNLDLLNILGCMIKRFLEQESEREKLLDDLLIVVQGLIQVFKDKLHQLPSPFILRVLSLLTTHLEYQYDHLNIFGGRSRIRYEIFRLFLSLRAEDESYHLGLAENDGSIYFSPYIICRSPEEEEESELLWNKQQLASRPSSPSLLLGTKQKSVLYISLNKACLLVIECLERETDWNVLSLVLTRVPTVLQNRPLICRYGKSINKFVTPLVCFTDKNSAFPLHLTNTPSKFSKSDFHNHVFPVLAALASYNEFLVPNSQSSLIRALELGLLSKECNRICIVALTTSALEMKSSMYHLIPEVLLNFSKISATKFISTPILEFLSTMVRLPEVFSSFTDTNYITVFAIALPFTNPFKFDPYTVSLAHHVIVMWFLKCRLSYRQNFVKFIITSLNSNIFVPFEENDKNKDSIGRARSTSLSATGRPNAALAAKKAASTAVPTSAQIQPLTFHQELTETCLDILARYMFGNVSIKTRRLKTSDFILKNGHSATWLIGTMLITVSTSCCTHIAMRSGVCDRCYFYCIRDEAVSKDDITKNSERRRHASEFYAGGNNNKVSSLRGESELHRHTSLERMESSSAEDGKMKKILPETCSCWCSGWAEIYIRRPSGDVSWMCRVQNTQLLSAHSPSTNLRDLTALFDTSLNKDSLNLESSTEEDRINVENLSEEEYKKHCAEFVPTSVSSPSESDRKALDKSSDGEAVLMSPKSPVKKTKSSPSDIPSHSSEIGETKRKSCDPIPEVEEDLRSGNDLRRRQSDAWRKSLPPGNDESQPTPLNSSPNSSFESNLNQPSLRATRSHTISVSSPRNRFLSSTLNKPLQPTTSGIVGRPGIGGVGSGEKNDKVSGISPQFVFLMLYQSSTFGNPASLEKPLLLHPNKITETSIKNLDRIPAYETHKIGVLYIGPNQVNDEVGILRNISGSSRYTDFLDGLGNLINIRNIDKATHFIGGLDSDEGDGDFAYMWEDDVMQVIFHVATLMPNHDNDPQANKKKRHIGNNYVAIVYNDSGNHSESYKMGTVRGKFISACIVITPLDQGSNRVCVDCKPELKEPLGHVMDPKIVSDKSLSILVRQWALHCNLAAHILKSLGNKMPYSSNWLERLRAIKRLKEKLLKENEKKEEEDREQGTSRPQLNDFTEFVILRKKKSNDGGAGD